MTDTVQSTQIELQLRDAIDRNSGTLIASMKEMVDGTRLGGDMTSTQMSGLLAVATETECVPVVISFIQYQIGRDQARPTGPKSWAVGEFGEKLIKEIQNLREGAKSRASEVTGKQDEATIDRVWMQMTRLYLGHLRRYFVYKRPPKEARP